MPSLKELTANPDRLSGGHRLCAGCGACAYVCPVDAIELTHIYDLTGESRADLLYDREKLLGVYDRTKNDPRDPVRTRLGILGPAAEFPAPFPGILPAKQAHWRGQARRIF